MKCCQCERRAIVQIEGTDDGSVIPLCVDCNLKWEQARTMEFARLVSAHNEAAASLENVAGIPVARYQVPRIPLSVGTVTMNNIRIGGDLLGVLNTGSIQTVDNSVTAIRNAGDPELAKRLAAFVETVARSGELSDAQKREILEFLSVVSSDVTAPPKERRSTVMLSLIANISTIIGTAATIAADWGQLGPLLARAFAR